MTRVFFFKLHLEAHFELIRALTRKKVLPFFFLFFYIFVILGTNNNTDGCFLHVREELKLAGMAFLQILKI